MSDAFTLLMGKLDELEASIVKGRRKSFWLGWASGTIGALLAQWWLS